MVIIDKDACIGCGACVGGCPVGALSLSDEGYSVCDGDTCIDCFRRVLKHILYS